MYGRKRLNCNRYNAVRYETHKLTGKNGHTWTYTSQKISKWKDVSNFVSHQENANCWKLTSFYMLSQHSLSMWLAGLIIWCSLHGSHKWSLQEGGRGSCQSSLRLGLELVQCHFNHVALVKVVIEPAQIPEEGKWIQPLNSGSDRICSHP